MTFPLQALAVGAIVAGFVGIPAALGGSNAIEHFLEPSFTASAVHAEGAPAAEPAAAEGAAAAESHEGGAEEHSTATELGLMGLSLLIAIFGIGLAHKFYVTSPEISAGLAEQWAGPHRTLSNKYYVDELYGATFIRATWSSARGMWIFDARVVDGAVNLVGWIIQESSHVFRRLQTGLVQNYALLMLFGIFAFVSVYLFLR